MSIIDDALDYNKTFVENKLYEQYISTKYPNKKIAILTCMDTRLTELLLASLGFKNGDIKVIKNAGAMVSHPFGSVMRSLLIAVYSLEVEEIMVIGHHDCGMLELDTQEFIQKMTDRGIKMETFQMLEACGIDIDKWLQGFESVEGSVSETVHRIKAHPLMPENVPVHGFVIHPETGKMKRINET